MAEDSNRRMVFSMWSDKQPYDAKTEELFGEVFSEARKEALCLATAR
jgi:hypothetical protein